MTWQHTAGGVQHAETETNHGHVCFLRMVAVVAAGTHDSCGGRCAQQHPGRALERSVFEAICDHTDTMPLHLRSSFPTECLCFLFGGEGFESCTAVALDLVLAIMPAFVDPGNSAACNGIPACHSLLKRILPVPACLYQCYRTNWAGRLTRAIRSPLRDAAWRHYYRYGRNVSIQHLSLGPGVRTIYDRRSCPFWLIRAILMSSPAACSKESKKC